MANSDEFEEEFIEDDIGPQSFPSSSLATAFELDPQSDPQAQRLFDEEYQRLDHDKKYNGVLEICLDDSRRTTTSWCTCGACSIAHHRHPRSMFCCVEAKLAETACGIKYCEKFGDFSCIVQYPEFPTLALDEVAVAATARLLAKRGDQFQELFGNSQLRKAACRNLTMWIYGPLKKKDRRILPSCVVDAIRQKFPKSSGESYMGFIAPYERVLNNDDEGNSSTDPDDVRDQNE